MEVVFYGERGSFPTPLTPEDYQKNIKTILDIYNNSNEKNIDQFVKTLPLNLYQIRGGNTSCFTIEKEKSDLIVFDAGSGLIELGKKLKFKNNLNIHIFLSHFHWDHICGIPFFKPLYNPSNTIYFYSTDKNLLKNLIRQQLKPFFPISFSELAAKKKFSILKFQVKYQLKDFSFRAIPLKNPGVSTGYIFESDKKKIGYVTEVEFTPDDIHNNKMFYKACFEGIELLIMGSQHNLKDYYNKFTWGHTSYEMVADLALEWRVKKLILFHSSPEQTDEDMNIVIKKANEQIKQYNRRQLDIIQAYEGLTLKI